MLKSIIDVHLLLILNFYPWRHLLTQPSPFTEYAYCSFFLQSGAIEPGYPVYPQLQKEFKEALNE